MVVESPCFFISSILKLDTGFIPSSPNNTARKAQIVFRYNERKLFWSICREFKL